MKLVVTKDSDEYFVLQRDGKVVLISQYSSRVADIVADLLDNDGKLTLIPEPIVEGEK